MHACVHAFMHACRHAALFDCACKKGHMHPTLHLRNKRAQILDNLTQRCRLNKRILHVDPQLVSGQRRYELMHPLLGVLAPGSSRPARLPEPSILVSGQAATEVR